MPLKRLPQLSCYVLLLLVFSGNTNAQTYPADTTYEVISPPPDAEMPGYLESYDNLTTNTQIQRITQLCDIVSLVGRLSRHSAAKPLWGGR